MDYIEPSWLLDLASEEEDYFESLRLKEHSEVHFEPPAGGYVSDVRLKFVEGKQHSVIPVLVVDMGRFGTYELKGASIGDEYSLQNMAADYFKDTLERAIEQVAQAAAKKYNERVISSAFKTVARDNEDVCKYDPRKKLLVCEIETPSGATKVQLGVESEWW